jgi:hypothetical protein
MNLTIKNLRGIESAEIPLDKITLVCGMNGAGKTSVSMAAAACLMQTAAPVAGMMKKDARLLLRDGQKSGSASLNGITVHWPGGTVSGDPAPVFSAMTAGVESLATMPPKERGPWLIENLKAEPEREAVVAALTGIGLPAAGVDAVLGEITANGWDAAHARARDNGTKAKGAWEQITGERWGEQKAQGWKPGTLTMTDPEAINQAVAVSQAAYDAAVATSAVAQSEIDRLMVLAARAGDLAAMAVQAGEKLTALEQAEASAAETLRRTPAPGKPETTAACPDCGVALVVVSATELRHPVQIKIDDGSHGRALATHTAALTALRQARDTVAAAARERNAAHDAVAALENMPAATGSSHSEASEALHAAQAQALDYRRMMDAERQRQGVLRSAMIADLLAPDGLRRDALESQIEAMNQQVGAICTRAGWKPATVQSDGSIAAAGRPYALLSASEQFRVRVALQIWQAAREASPLIIVDAADILDGPGRAGLMRALGGLRALVTMTYDSRAKMPAARDGFAVCWVDGGTVHGGAA